MAFKFRFISFACHPKIKYIIIMLKIDGKIKIGANFMGIIKQTTIGRKPRVELTLRQLQHDLQRVPNRLP